MSMESEGEIRDKPPTFGTLLEAVVVGTHRVFAVITGDADIKYEFIESHKELDVAAFPPGTECIELSGEWAREAFERASFSERSALVRPNFGDLDI